MSLSMGYLSPIMSAKQPFAAINLISPFIMAMSALGFMMGTGGSAIVAKTLGEGKKEKAGEYFFHAGVRHPDQAESL